VIGLKKKMKYMYNIQGSIENRVFVLT